jgi:predicted DNA-binding transcriptional regulator AlpA
MATDMARKQRPDDILTSPTAAKIAGIHRVHFARLIREGKGPRHQAVKAGARHLVLILRRDLEAWMAARDQ